MNMLTQPHRRWAIAAEAAFLLVIFVGLAIGEFSEHRLGMAWFGLAMTPVIVASATYKWRRVRRV